MDVIKGVVRAIPVPACALAATDLRSLFLFLAEKAKEAAQRQVATWVKLDNQTDEQFKAAKDFTEGQLRLVVQIQGGNGQWIAATTADALSSDTLASEILQVTYDSAFLFRSANSNQNPLNFFSLTLDFRRVNIFDFTTSPSAATPNQSIASVSGNDATWVNGVSDEIEKFLRDHGTARGWLHRYSMYDVLLFLVAFPLSFAWVARLDRLLKTAGIRWPEALFVAFYVYIVLLTLFVFRITFNYARWVFPRIEGPGHRGPVGHRVVLGALILGMLGTPLWELLKAIAGL